MEHWIMLAVLMLLTGSVAGVLAGLFGIGGGIVIVPVLEGALGILGVDPAIRMHVAVATSLATIVPTSISSSLAHHRRNAVDVDIVRRWAIFVLLGALLGAWIASQLQSRTLAIVFAILALLVALKMIFAPTARNLTDAVPRAFWVPVIPTFIGCASSMMGIGGGTFSVMTLTLFNQPIHRAVGTAALFGLVISLPGTIGFVVNGWHDARLPPGSLGYVNLVGLALIAPATIVTAPLGAKLAHRFSAARLSMLFGCFLLLAAGRLAFAGELEPDPPINCPDCAEWNEPEGPLHIFGNTYFVGTAGVSAVLIDAGNELVLLDGGLPQSAARIVASIAELGFDPRNIGTIALSHEHFDHAGGIAALQRLTGARVLSSQTGALALRAGDLQPDDPQFSFGHDKRSFPAVPDAVAVADGYELTVGDLVLRGVYTPGHTPGGMSWTWRSCEGARCLNIVYADSLSAVAAPGYKFSAGLGKALRNSIETIAKLDCNILLVTHPFVFDFQEKAASGREAFIDDQACARYATSAMQQLQRRLSIEATEAPSKRSR
jgi:uncharacterized membrane protein YfcA/glyoxylase-like metal-dependent hydrolase (beta-lactamase superfamily II)